MPDLIELESCGCGSGEIVLYRQPGKKGLDGITPSLTMGPVTTLEADQPATAELVSLSPYVYRLDLAIPKGTPGESTTTDGVSPEIVGVKVEPLLPGATAYAIFSGPDQQHLVLNLFLPAPAAPVKGDPGVTPAFSSVTVEVVAPDAAPVASIDGPTTALVLHLQVPRGTKGDPGDASQVRPMAYFESGDRTAANTSTVQTAQSAGAVVIGTLDIINNHSASRVFVIESRYNLRADDQTDDFESVLVRTINGVTVDIDRRNIKVPSWSLYGDTLRHCDTVTLVAGGAARYRVILTQIGGGNAWRAPQPFMFAYGI